MDRVLRSKSSPQVLLYILYWFFFIQDVIPCIDDGSQYLALEGRGGKASSSYLILVYLFILFIYWKLNPCLTKPTEN